MKTNRAAAFILIVWTLTQSRGHSQNECMIENSLRLRNGRDLSEGRVEMCTRLRRGRLEWSAVCDNGWDVREARVVCRQLGFNINNVPVVAKRNNYFGKQFRQRVSSMRWVCTGRESNLTDCTRTVCNNGQSAGVYCTGIQRSNCQDGDVRLVNGSTSFEGRVEICKGGLWGSVCHNQWSDNDATTVCRQLGRNDSRQAFATVRALFGEGSGPIHLNNVQCSSDTDRLEDCLSFFNTQSCGHYQDAGVACSGQEDCNDGQLRLVNGADEMEGRVEICFRGVWGTVCDDDWNNQSATVVCRQLDLGDVGWARVAARYGEGNGPILLDDVRCDGSESQLTECLHRHIGIHNCNHREDASVVCSSTIHVTTTTPMTQPGTLSTTTMAPQTSKFPTNIVVSIVVVVLVAIALLIAVMVVVAILIHRRRKHKMEQQENRPRLSSSFTTSNEHEPSNNYYAVIQSGETTEGWNTNPLHNSPIYNVIQNGNPLPYEHITPGDENQSHDRRTHDLVTASDYEEPKDSLNARRAKEVDREEDDYSTLGPSQENDYATLEPFIPGAKKDRKSPRDNDDYSYLQHQ